MLEETNNSVQAQPQPKPGRQLESGGFDAEHPPVTNKQLAKQLELMAELLVKQKADFWRIKAYQQGTKTLADLSVSAQSIFLARGIDGLIELPDIGKGIAAAIVEILHTGHWTKLERLRGQHDPVWLFTQVPGIGAELAKRIIDQHNIDSLEGLESAAHDGRLARVRGIGLKRLDGIKASLHARLHPRASCQSGGRVVEHPTVENNNHPSVSELLSVDSEYRTKAAAGKLTKIAPKRFNPKKIAWLPILHSTRGDWHVTAIFSNTDRAHVMRKTQDWVVLYCHADHLQECQFTVVTEIRGPLDGRRVIRGLEDECKAYYLSATVI